MSTSVKIIDNSNLIKQAKDEAVLRALEAIGIEAEGDAKDKLTELKPHKSGSPKLRGSVDTGRLRGSISHTVKAEENAVYVGTNVEYGKYVELGTQRSPAYPYSKPAVQENLGKYKKIIESELKK